MRLQKSHADAWQINGRSPGSAIMLPAQNSGGSALKFKDR